MKLNFSERALRSLNAIWLWNAEQYGADHAERYVAFLRAETDNLTMEHASGKGVPNHPLLQYAVIRRKRRGHGHLAVYAVIGDNVHVVDYFHTAQDWQRMIVAEG